MIVLISLVGSQYPNLCQIALRAVTSFNEFLAQVAVSQFSSSIVLLQEDAKVWQVSVIFKPQAFEGNSRLRHR